MTRALLRAATFVVFLPATSAFADVSSEDVWNDLLRTSKAFGQNVTADIRRDGDTLIAENVAVDIVSSPTLGEITTTIERIDLEDLEDGTVVVRFPTPLVVISEQPADFSDDMFFGSQTTYELSGDILASGDPDALSYRIAAGDLRMETYPLDASDDDMSLSIAMDIEDMSAFWTSVQEGDTSSGTYDIDAAAIRYSATTADPDGNEAFEVTYRGEAYMSDGSFERDTSAGAETLSSVLSTTVAHASQEIQSMTFDVAAQGETPFSMSGVGGLTRGEVSLEGGVGTYSASVSGIEVEAASSAFPLPGLNGKIASFEVAGTAPLSSVPDTAPFGVRIAITDLEVSETIWSLLDPSAQLPRDPATVVIDASGKGVFKNGLLDAMPMPTSGPGLPFEVETLAINDLTLRALGAEITAEGSGVSQGIVNGAPDIVGALDIKMIGVTGLIDKLAGMGMLPMEQAGMAQMMIGMLARPGETPEEFVARIERTADGQLLSNGLPLPF